ncbi:hypothetical protein EVAR_24040_1 [Eumeta japonica]|uniref:Uncharacterized protein n=1 Tax=Eumeta variegata TaxID=151549 RepID=A0A4C1WBF0_EUMVA|nr:hypothetical protein EVAR_24040_1 [Eumeta japonica]
MFCFPTLSSVLTDRDRDELSLVLSIRSAIPVPNVHVFYNMFRRLFESGIHHAEPGVNPGRHNTDDEEIIAAFEAIPTTSGRVTTLLATARNLNFSI